ncbi:MAG: hypothetical protein EOO89_23620 [Pedobacter sp.]|nr:MAG: hypothetical protein EOO89_23620 [Pedobacter sp.]
MRIVHSTAKPVRTRTAKPKEPTQAEQEQLRARRWKELQDHKNFRAALKEHAEDIEWIREHSGEPDWTPVKE